MLLGKAAAEILAQLHLEPGDLTAGGSRKRILGPRDRYRGRGRGELTAHRVDRASGGDDGLLELGELGTRCGHAVGDRAGAGKHSHVTLLELHPALLGFLELLLAAAQFLVEEGQRLLGALRVAGNLAAGEDVDQLLGDRCGGPGILGIGQAGEARRRGDFEQIVGLSDDLDTLAKAGDDPPSAASLVTSLLRSVRRTTLVRFSFDVSVCLSRRMSFCGFCDADAAVGTILSKATNSLALAW
jgi:hypothetical protein